MQYFPDLSLGNTYKAHKIYSEWLALHLSSMQEKSLWENKTSESIYRFTWLRTFHQPVVIRLEMEGSMAGILQTKITNGNGAYNPGEIIYNEKSKVKVEDLDIFKGYLILMNFWNIPSYEDHLSLDGAGWILEGLHNGTYKIVIRWSPKEGDFRELGLHLVAMANITVQSVY